MSETLKNELLADPLTRGFASLSDPEILAVNSVPDRVIYSDIPVEELASTIFMSPIYGILEAAAASNENARKLLRIVEGAGRVETFRYSRPETRAALDGMLADLVASVDGFTEDHATALKALGTSTGTRWQELGIDPTERDIFLIMDPVRKASGE